ncbi:hypothetical protein BOTCAL_0060g00240 [Botryotinia calthae]|uniref:Uncharacterized protein n=1 Tax=Botryotinia calthae TaxID=38488 RepID=A0A4Y8DCC8_9HELO|nr:hypothetical protein BOTCAL_0060g00240 [Botryotinia calthae]
MTGMDGTSQPPVVCARYGFNFGYGTEAPRRKSITNQRGKFFALASASLFDGEEILPVYDAQTAQGVYKSQISEITYWD